MGGNGQAARETELFLQSNLAKPVRAPTSVSRTFEIYSHGSSFFFQYSRYMSHERVKKNLFKQLMYTFSSLRQLCFFLQKIIVLFCIMSKETRRPGSITTEQDNKIQMKK